MNHRHLKEKQIKLNFKPPKVVKVSNKNSNSYLLAVQHERKPILDRKQDAHKSSTSENDQEIPQSKSRLKKDSANDSVNYLSLFQLNPLLMHAGVNPSQSYQQSLCASSPTKAVETTGIKMEEPFVDDVLESKATNQESSELFESVLEQKLLNDTFDMINMIESSLQGNYEAYNSNGSPDENLTPIFLANLTDETVTQFKIQLPNLLPKMHFVCEVGSRILFKSIDWLRDIHVWQYFGAEAQSEMLKLSWTELLVIGLAQVISSSPQSMQLKSMIVSTLVNYVKSLILYSTNESNQLKIGGKSDAKSTSGQKLKKMLNNIMLINKFADTIAQLELDGVEFAHLRILSLFNPNKCYATNLKLKSHHQQVAANLQNYLRVREKSQEVAHERVVQIYQALPILPTLDGKIIEKLFFNILVDFIRIDNVIPYIMNLNAGAEVKKEKELDLNDENNSHSMNSDDQRYYNYSGDEKSWKSRK